MYFASDYFGSDYFSSNYFVEDGGGAGGITPTLTSSAVTVFNVGINLTIITEPELVAVGVTVPQLSLNLKTTVSPSLLDTTIQVTQPSISANIFVSPYSVSNTVTVDNVSISLPLIVRPSITDLSVVLDPVDISRPITVNPSLVDYVVAVMNPFTTDISENFYSNDTMIEFFRTQTGLDIWDFNDLARAYYKQVSLTDQESFNELNKSAQDAENFTGLAPVDWRNF